MECRRITGNSISSAWNIDFDVARQELFVPEFCVYVFAVVQGQINLTNQNLQSIVSAQTLVCLPPMPLALKLECQDRATIKIFKIDAWYFISHFFTLPTVTTLPKITFPLHSEHELIEYLQEQHLPKTAPEQTQRIKDIVENHTNQLSDKQVNRYLKSWFGLTISQLKKINQIEAFVKSDCSFTGTKTRLIHNVDYETFYDYSHFGHTFKSVTGMTPEAYLTTEGTVQSLFW